MITANNMPYTLNYPRSYYVDGFTSAGYPGFILTNQWSINTDTVKNGPLAATYAEGFNKLHPIVFSHGFFADVMSYTAFCRELASYGYIVFSVGHQDGSAMFTTDADDNAIFFDSSLEFEDMDGKNAQLDIRTNEVIQLKTELGAMTNDSELYKQIFGDFTEAQLDMQRFTLSGHSFGGLTAINAAQQLTNENCHACLTMDPWLRPKLEAIMGDNYAFDVDF